MNEPENWNDDQSQIERATRLTTTRIRTILEKKQSPQDTRLSIAEREELIQEISQIIPAGNVVNFILSGLLSAKQRNSSPSSARSHINALFKGLSFMRQNVLYSMVFAGPATILAGYNLLLQLSGNDIESYLPDGAWQFYVEFGLREDAAHHQTETVGFQRVIREKIAHAAPETLLTAWVLASASILQQYSDLLELRWEENTKLRIIEETTGLTGLFRQWEKSRTFSAPDFKTSLVAYRQQIFDQFCDHHLSKVSKAQWQAFSEIWHDKNTQEVFGRQKRAYIRQLSVHRYLEPGDYSDERMPIDIARLRVGVVSQGNYYLLPATVPSSPAELLALQEKVKQILYREPNTKSNIDTALVQVPRQNQTRVRGMLPAEMRSSIEHLQTAPFIINWDHHDHSQPLTTIRNQRRGIGDHGATLFVSSTSTVFDFSHIFFDGPWALAIAEMVSNEAIKYTYLLTHSLSSASVESRLSTDHVTPLPLHADQALQQRISQFRKAKPEISAETKRDIHELHRVRTTLKDRAGMRLTINDLLVLYRTIFNSQYVMSDELRSQLSELRSQSSLSESIASIEKMIEVRRYQQPSLLIPIDATRYSPKERLFASTFRSPLPNFLEEHDGLVKLLQASETDDNAHRDFTIKREYYLGYLQAFCELMQRYREIATSGESMSSTAIRLIAGLPGAMQQIVDSIPGRLTVVNEAIKGEEVFSNVGRVVNGSTITRFSSAKDDNDQKILVWGIMTDDDDRLTITLRDFRKPVLQLANAGQTEIAQRITADYLEQFVAGVYRFSKEMESIVGHSYHLR